jgi:hypothetical protein
VKPCVLGPPAYSGGPIPAIVSAHTPYTGVNLHRYLLPLDAEGFCHKHSTLLRWHTRREVWSIHQNHEASSRRCQLPWSTYLSEVVTMTTIRRLDLNKNIFAL